MASNNESKEIDIKNCTYHHFDDMNNVKNFNSNFNSSINDFNTRWCKTLYIIYIYIYII